MSIEDVKRQKWREYYHKRDKEKLKEYRKRYRDKDKLTNSDDDGECT